ncbi:MAG: hypothetical protein ABI609_18660 [Acidobacteriota bacterium]
MRFRRLRFVPSLVVAALCLTSPARSAQPGDESRVLADLLRLPSDTAPVLYSPGALDRAAHVQKRLESVVKDVHSWAGVDLDLHGLVLAPEDWQALHVSRPYGIPQVVAAGLAVPAWGDEHSVAFWQRYLGAGLPWGGGTPLLGSTEEAASVGLADTFLQVECGRFAAAKTVGIRGPEWIAELLAHVVALSAVMVHEEERLPEIAAGYARLANHWPAAPAVSAFSAEIDFDTWLSYQPVFHRGAEIVLAKDGRKAAKNLLRLPRGNGGQLMTGDLLKRYPALAEWLGQ